MSGFVIWMTGLSGAGKSTLSTLLSQELTRRGKHVECLDGDEVRKNLSHGLGFSREDRDRNVRRIGYVARMVARSGACAITASISPYRALRDEIRSKTDNFVEVYCDCPIEVLTERDPKGLYKRALAGELKNFTGVSDPYEAPEHPDVHLRTDTSNAEECLCQILDVLERRGFFRERSSVKSLPGALGGEVFEARKASLAEVEATHQRVSVDAELAEMVSAVGSGYFSPLSGFMTERETTKVEATQALERGTPWWEQTFVLEADHDKTPPAIGEAVALYHGNRALGLMRVEEVWERLGHRYLAGPLEALLLEAYSVPTARQCRRTAEEREWTRVACLFSTHTPNEGRLSLVKLALALSDAVVMAVATSHLNAWKRALEPIGCSCVAVPQSFPLGDRRAQMVLQRSIGATSGYSIDDANV